MEEVLMRLISTLMGIETEEQPKAIGTYKQIFEKNLIFQVFM